MLRRRLGISFWLAIAWLALMAFVALFAPILPLTDPTQVAFGGPRESPSLDAWFGTDALGRDVFSRTMHGARISLAVGGFAFGASILFWLALDRTVGARVSPHVEDLGQDVAELGIEAYPEFVLMPDQEDLDALSDGPGDVQER